MGEKPKACDWAARIMLVAGALTLGSPLGGCVGYDGDFDRGYQVDEETVSQIKVGATTKPQALALLGTPSTTSTVGGRWMRNPKLSLIMGQGWWRLWKRERLV